MFLFGILGFNLSISNEYRLDNFSLSSNQLKKALAVDYELPEVTITCDAPRYGKCNALFVYDIPDHPMVFLCEFTGDPKDDCNHWEEIVCNTSACIMYLWTLGIF